MNDPWGSFQNFMNGFQMMMKDPKQYVMDNYGIPKEKADNPDAIIQHLMSEGKVSQQQYNMARQAAMRIQSNPLFGQFMNRR